MATTEPTALPIVSRNPCRTCSRCCRAYAVPVNGQDVWRIWRSQRLSPEKFTVTVDVPTARPDAFRLAADGDLLILILDKKGPLQPTRPCVFLMELPGGFDRCAIYQDRPAACRAYPMVPAPGRVAVNLKALCPPNSWTDEDIGRDTWREILRQADLQYDVYSVVVAYWNDRVSRHPGRQFALDEYFGYLFNVYERIGALDQLITPDEHRAIRASWGHAASGNDPAAARPWIQYVEQIQQILETFFPRLNPKVTAD